LLELAPDGLVAASATISVPQALDRVISRLRNDRQWTDRDFTTAVSSPDVVASGLVKERISLGGYITPMETAVDALLADMRDAAAAAEVVDEPFAPKAIYVCTTSAVDGVPIAKMRGGRLPESGELGLFHPVTRPRVIGHLLAGLTCVDRPYGCGDRHQREAPSIRRFPSKAVRNRRNGRPIAHHPADDFRRAVEHLCRRTGGKARFCRLHGVELGQWAPKGGAVP